MYQVVGGVQSRAFRVMWTLEELGQDYDHIECKPHSPEAMAANPSGKIPALRVDDDVLTDSTAILTYLADKHGALNSFVLPEERRVPEVKDSLRWEFARNARRLASRLEGPFLMGETMTIADIVAAHCLNWAYSAKFPIEDERLLTYAKAMRGREAFRRVVGR